MHKLSLQLADSSPEAVQLMAELNWLLLLFSSNIKPNTKWRMVMEICHRPEFADLPPG